MSARIVGDYGVRNSMMREFPGRQRSPLVARPSFVDPHMDGYSGIESFVNRREGGSPINCRQPSGVAMGQDLKWSLFTQAFPVVSQQQQSMPAKNRAFFGLLIGDRESFAIGRIGALRRGKAF